MIVAVYGSPRRGGNTDMLMEAFLEPVSEREEIRRLKLREMRLQPCIACGGCNETGVCIFDDDIWRAYQSIADATGIVVSSPVFFASVTSQLKTFIDRAQAFWVARFVLGKVSFPLTNVGFFICAGAAKIDKYFLNARLVVQSHMKSLGIPYMGDLFCPGVDEKGEVTKIEGILTKAREAGLQFIERLGSS